MNRTCTVAIGFKQGVIAVETTPSRLQVHRVIFLSLFNQILKPTDFLVIIIKYLTSQPVLCSALGFILGFFVSVSEESV